ncbi:hypothetical protein HHL16_07405 [Pseudoflavitalea sp. G-6-1-2]|uniref:hypothetical protein n=1 Tax=Pseudoflavitalea sp. G-6-1-2 TaxID=2728841 RepID=UPI00146ED86F|nr:hypothetical protein [Pseudoflavitalea sp. G-6-1-2]NML20694.1 hypothetical protein [Pseudoflavitalea sp. G-6-1-2]
MPVLNLIRHKLNDCIAVLTAFALLSVSCKKEGPPGADGNANVRSATVTPANAEWKWSSTWTLTISTGSTLYYNTRFLDINTDLITQDIVDKGSVQVFFKPNNDGWAPLPYVIPGFYQNYNFVYEYKKGLLRLHYFWSAVPGGGAVPAGLGTFVLPTYTFKYVITAAK